MSKSGKVIMSRCGHVTCPDVWTCYMTTCVDMLNVHTCGHVTCSDVWTCHMSTCVNMLYDQMWTCHIWKCSMSASGHLKCLHDYLFCCSLRGNVLPVSVARF